jgi:8-oxo-dGTP pyrophosphatase MutT (NUDIX family)
MDVWERLSALPPVERPRDARYAVLVPIYDDVNGSTRVIFTSRPEHMRTHPGDVVFPGGAIEQGESPIDAAMREAWEEIMLPSDNVLEILGGLKPLTSRNPDRIIVPVVARIERPPELVPDPAEVEHIIEPKIEDLLDDERWESQDWQGFEMWFYEFDEAVLWGATAYMVRDLLRYLR